MKREADAAVGATSDAGLSVPATSTSLPNRAKALPPLRDDPVPKPLSAETSQAVEAPESLETPATSGTPWSAATSQQPEKQMTSSGDMSQASSHQKEDQVPSQNQGSENEDPAVPFNGASLPTERPSIANNPQGSPPRSFLERYAGIYRVGFSPDRQYYSIEFIVVGRTLWGSFDLGYVNGVLKVLPPLDSDRSANFCWRGCVFETGEFYGGMDNGGWVSVSESGDIEGFIDYEDEDLHFRGRRQGGAGTKATINVEILRQSWDQYHGGMLKDRARWDSY